jgi:hypothetical protein
VSSCLILLDGSWGKNLRGFCSDFSIIHVAVGKRRNPDYFREHAKSWLLT